MIPVDLAVVGCILSSLAGLFIGWRSARQLQKELDRLGIKEE